MNVDQSRHRGVGWWALWARLMVLLGIGGLQARGADDLSSLSDEFRMSSSRANWQRIYETEGWGNDALRVMDFGQQRPGELLMIPHTSVWYEEWRGELTYKEVTGDFVITTDVEVSRRGGGGAPNSAFSLAGIMVRAPRGMTSPAQWTPGGQNYVFLSLGAATSPGQYQHEVKTTVNSVSVLEVSPGTRRAQIQVARLGRHLILLRRPEGGEWVVHRRYSRPDFPATLQAGLTVYTDWPGCQRVGFAAQNTTVLTNGARLPNGGQFTGANPDLEATFDYVRYSRPSVPSNWVGRDYSNPAAVSDAELLSILGDHAHQPAERLVVRVEPGGAGAVLRMGYPSGGRVEQRRLSRIQVVASKDVTLPISEWRRVSAPLSLVDGQAVVVDTGALGVRQFYLAMEEP